jgi:hypothetical protein
MTILKVAYWTTGFVAVLLLSFLLFVPRSAFSHCSEASAIKDKEEALDYVMFLVVEENLAAFPELGGSVGFVNLLRQEPGCCAARGGAFDWTYMTWVWGVDLRSPVENLVIRLAR